MNDKKVEQLQDFAVFVYEGHQRGMTRREFLRRGLALGLSLTTINAVLTGCGVQPSVAAEPSQTPTAAASPTAVPSATPRPTATATPQPTATPRPTATPVPVTARIGVIGDFGWGSEPELYVSQLVKGWEPDFIITTGDNNYPTGTSATIDRNIGQFYHEYMAHAGSEYGPNAPLNRFFPVLGNHDVDTDLGSPYFDYFVLPGNERYYVVDWPPVRFYAVNSVAWNEPDGVRPDSVQAMWLKNELAASTQPWNLVAFHHPPYTSSWKGASSWMRWPFQEWGATAVLNGHQHAYERIMLNGFPYFTNGLGGAPRYAWGEQIAEGSEVRFNAEHGAMLIDASSTTIVFQFITITGEVVDRYELTAG